MRIKEQYIGYLLLIIISVVYFTLLFLSDGVYGGADNFIHYRVSRYAFEYPHLLLDHWGKPFYTLLSAPFSQFGFTGARLFNTLLALLSCWIGYRIAVRLKYQQASLVIIFAAFAPMYLLMAFTAMTEILFSFILVFSAYLLLRRKYVFAAILLSFLMFVRTEGFVLLPAYALFLLLEKQYKAIFFLFTGFLLYSIIGYFYYDDFFWVINESPYTDAKKVYGQGDLLRFVTSFGETSGIYIGILLVAGVLSMLFRAFSLNKKLLNDRQTAAELLLIFAPLFGYFSFHSILWWQGMGGSLGLTRVMAAILPLAAILALKGWNLFCTMLKLPLWSAIALSIVLAFLVIRDPFVQFHFPTPLSSPQELVKEAADWVRNSEYADRRMYYYDPLFYHFLKMDPYDKEKIREKVPDYEQPEKEIEHGSLVLWDAHLGPNEGRLPLKRLKENPFFIELKAFRPEVPFQVLGGYDYEVYVFQRQTFLNWANPDSNNIMIGFETFHHNTNTDRLSAEYAFEGEKSFFLDTLQPFYNLLETKMADIGINEAFEITMEGMALLPFDSTLPVSFVVSFENEKGSFSYIARAFDDLHKDTGYWHLLTHHALSPPTWEAEDKIKIYIWYRGKSKVYIDALRMKIKRKRL